jgi:hypothetical protein
MLLAGLSYTILENLRSIAKKLCFSCERGHIPTAWTIVAMPINPTQPLFVAAAFFITPPAF